MKLHHDVLRKEGPRRTLVMLHGILGTGNNLRGLARKFTEARPEWNAVLIDLRAHGLSQDAPGDADTLANAARDVVETMQSLPLDVHAVVGHSFGGKVALAIDGLPMLQHVMTLDSAPGSRPDARGSESTFEVLTMLHELKGPWPKREAFVADVTARGQSMTIAQWLAMNLDQRADGLHFRLQMPRIDALIDDYLNVDLWSRLERTDVTTHLVIGERSQVYEHDDRVRAQVLESGGAKVTVDLLDAGHWIHVDAADGVLDAMTKRLTPPV